MERRILVFIVLAIMGLTTQAGDLPDHYFVSRVDDANVIIYREKDDVLSASFYYRVYVNGDYVGKLQSESEYWLRLPEGQHRLMANDRDHHRIDIDVVAGKTLRVRGEIHDRPTTHLSWSVD